MYAPFSLLENGAKNPILPAYESNLLPESRSLLYLAIRYFMLSAWFLHKLIRTTPQAAFCLFQDTLFSLHVDRVAHHIS